MRIQQLSALTRFIPDPLPVREVQAMSGQADQNGIDDIPEYVGYDAPLRPSNHLGVKLGQHWTIVGTTGSGKTRFGVALLEYMRRQYPGIKRYVLDSNLDGMAGIYSPLFVEGDAVPDTLKNADHTLIWQPDTDNLEAFNEWLMRILKAREPAIVFLDETASLQARSGVALEGHIKLLKQGRRHGITTINLTQEISKVPLSMFRQMTHYVQFRIGNDVPEQSSARRFLNVTSQQQRHPLNEHGFFYRNIPKLGSHTEYRDLQEFFKSSIQGGKQGVSWEN